jgi:exodeoxyribonuclease VIII
MHTSTQIAEIPEISPAVLPIAVEDAGYSLPRNQEITFLKVVELEPGAYYGVPEEVYHSLPFISSSYLKRFKDCPADALIPVEKTDHMELGSALHCYTLEGQGVFEQRYATMFVSDLSKNSNDYRKKAEEFKSANAGKIILPSHTNKVPTMDVIKGVHGSLQAHPAAFKLLSQEGMTEVTLIWDDPITGLRCKARLDFFSEGIIADLKKTDDVQKFRNAIVSYNYDIQAAWYLTGAKACDLQAEKFVFIAMEAKAPYKVASGTLSEKWVEYGLKESQRLLGLAKECKERNTFPAFEIPQHITSLDQLTPRDLMIEWDMPSWR